MATNAQQAATPPTLELQKIGLSGLPDVLALWNKVKGELATGNKHHLKPLSEENLKSHIKSGFPILGVVDTANTHLAGVVLLSPVNTHSYNAYTADCVSELPYNLQQADTAVLHALAVDPDYQGNRIASDILLPAAEKVATGLGLCEIFAKHADDNLASKTSFGKAGYHFLKATTGSYWGKVYDATYVSKDLSGQAIALKDVPLFNGTHVKSGNVVNFPTAEHQ